jgi:hypothetical protein
MAPEPARSGGPRGLFFRRQRRGDPGQHVDEILVGTLSSVPRAARVQLRDAVLRASAWRGTLILCIGP